MTTGTMEQAIGFIMNSTIFTTKRLALSRDDFGDEATVGLNLRRTGKTINDYAQNDFAQYLGCHDGKYVVGNLDFWTWQITGCEIFDTLDDLKVKWELD